MPSSFRCKHSLFRSLLFQTTSTRSWRYERRPTEVRLTILRVTSPFSSRTRGTSTSSTTSTGEPTRNIVRNTIQNKTDLPTRKGRHQQLKNRHSVFLPFRNHVEMYRFRHFTLIGDDIQWNETLRTTNMGLQICCSLPRHFDVKGCLMSSCTWRQTKAWIFSEFNIFLFYCRASVLF